MCLHYFCWVSIESTNDWFRIAPLYSADMLHALSENLILIYTICIVRKLYDLDMSQTLSQNRKIWVRRESPIHGFFSHYFFFVSFETTNDWYRIAHLFQLELFSHHFFFYWCINICSFCIFLMVVCFACFAFYWFGFFCWVG